MIRSTEIEFPSKPEACTRPLFSRRTLGRDVLLFVGAAVLLFLLTSRYVGVFDEGILLTGTMRTMAGQVLHRDFNYNYGPAQLYLLAGLFKLFGPSILVERLAAAVSTSCLVVTLYALARKFCGRGIAFGAGLLCMLWLIGEMMAASISNPGICVLILWTSWLILPVPDDKLQRRRALAAGFLTAVLFFIRYDIGVEIAAANLLATVIMLWMQGPGSRRSLRRFVAAVVGPYLAAFIITIVPAAIAYLSVAPIHDLLYDVVIYMAKYYRAGRGLPLPKLQLGPLFAEDAVYLLPILIALGFWVVARWVMTARKNAADKSATQTPDWINLLVTLSIMGAVLCAKGLVRMGIGSIFGSLVACILLAAVLFTHRGLLNIWLRGVLTATVALCFLTAMSAAWGQLFNPVQRDGRIHLRRLVINWILTPNRQPPGPALRSWCHDGNPITRGFCYLLDDDHIKTISYLDAHTRPGDYLYVGLAEHDRIIMNDMITYFAAQRLPATRWTEFDPFLENRADVQREMIDELEQHKPPYVVLDSEFDDLWEPNGSSVHTGVHLLDDYIAAHYKAVQQYGKLTTLQRQG